ncbi:unnamed protein product [Paramecium pentaurelia]|uniref:Transmembrane protein n=1 Tax=Paramecium pentaurelia TaxID=43138 RepID=A0A8S1TVM0_9CILI|nr:unnamed protein product [Paramecium pentaurelia]
MQNNILFSNGQDEAILSERNEQEQFQSDLSNEDDESNDQIENEEEQEMNPKDSQTPTFPEQQIIKDETKKKDIKETCLEKIKAYIGFGNRDLFINEKIGSIFFLPISSNWTLKIQVTIAQIIIAITSLSLFIGVQFIGQNILFDTVQQWTNNNISELLQKQICEITIDFVQLLINTRENEIQLVNVTLDLIQSETLRYNGLLYKMDDQLPNSTRMYLPKISIIDQYTLNLVTYSLLSEQQISEKKIRNYLSINNIMYYNYQTMGSTFFWIFDDGFMMQYPGVNVTDIKIYNEYRLQMYKSRRYISYIPLEHTYDPILNEILQREVLPITDINNKQIGLIFCERKPFTLYMLFYSIATNNQYNYTLFLFTDQNDIIYYQTQEYEINIEEFQQVIKTMNTDDDSKLKKINLSKYLVHSESVEQYIHIYQGDLSGQQFLFAYVNYSGLLVGIFQPSYLPNEEIELQKNIYQKKIDNFNKKLIPIALSIPIVYIIICVFYMVRYIKPLQRITEYADQLLKKSQNFDEKQFEKQFNDSTGDDLIQQLTSLFAKLMGNLNKSKQLKKQEIIEFYNKQTYPKNQKSRDVTPIINEVKKIKLDSIVRDPGVLQFPNLDD